MVSMLEETEEVCQAGAMGSILCTGKIIHFHFEKISYIHCLKIKFFIRPNYLSDNFHMYGCHWYSR